MFRYSRLSGFQSKASLISKHSEVGIKDEIDDIIGCTNVETFAEPINCHISRWHGVKHEILQILQGLWRGEECVVFHDPNIHGIGHLCRFSRQLVNWSGSRLSLCYFPPKVQDSSLQPQ